MITVKVEGIDKALRELGSYTKEVQQGAVDAINTTALLVESDAKRFVPTDKGFLKDSIHTTPAKRSDPQAFVSTNKAYARRIELGFFGEDSAGRGRKKPFAQAGQPYMKPAAERNRRGHSRRLAEVLRK